MHNFSVANDPHQAKRLQPPRKIHRQPRAPAFEAREEAAAGNFPRRPAKLPARTRKTISRPPEAVERHRRPENRDFPRARLRSFAPSG